MTKPLNERVSLLDIQSPTKAKLQRWADLQTEELETLYASMKEQLSSIPSDEWDDWDKESFKVIGDIVSQKASRRSQTGNSKNDGVGRDELWH